MFFSRAFLLEALGLHAADIFGDRTTWMKVTTGRRIRGAWHFTCQDYSFLCSVWVGLWDSAHKGLCVRMQGIFENFLPVRILDNPAQIHHRNEITDMLHDGKVVSDKKICEL